MQQTLVELLVDVWCVQQEEQDARLSGALLISHSTPRETLVTEWIQWNHKTGKRQNDRNADLDACPHQNMTCRQPLTRLLKHTHASGTVDNNDDVQHPLAVAS